MSQITQCAARGVWVVSQPTHLGGWKMFERTRIARGLCVAGAIVTLSGVSLGAFGTTHMPTPSCQVLLRLSIIFPPTQWDEL